MGPHGFSHVAKEYFIINKNISYVNAYIVSNKLAFPLCPATMPVFANSDHRALKLLLTAGYCKHLYIIQSSMYKGFPCAAVEKYVLHFV